MSITVVFLGFFAGVIFAFWFVRFRHKRSKLYVVLYDGLAFRGYMGVRDGAGIKCNTESGFITYPFNVLVRVLINPISGLSVYVGAMAGVPLAQHEALEIGRQGIAFSAMFKSGGDLLRWLQIGALVVPIGVAIWLTLQFGNVINTLNANTADLKVVRDVVSRPLVVAPAASPTAEVK